MSSNNDTTGRRWRKCVQTCGGFALAWAIFATTAKAQASADSKPAEQRPAEIYQTVYLTNITGDNSANDIQTALRNVVSRARVYWVPSEGALAIRASAEDMQIAQKVISDLDRPKKSYRVTYTISEIDEGKRVGSQTFTVLVSRERKTVLKQGTRVPVVTGAADKGGSQVTYVDVRLNIEASLEGYQDGARLRSKVEQSRIADERSGIGVQDPDIRQTSLEGTSALTQGKPVLLGSLDVAGSTRRQEIEVVALPAP